MGSQSGFSPVGCLVLFFILLLLRTLGPEFVTVSALILIGLMVLWNVGAILFRLAQFFASRFGNAEMAPALMFGTIAGALLILVLGAVVYDSVVSSFGALCRWFVKLLSWRDGMIAVVSVGVLIVGGINYSSTRRALLTNGTLSFSELSTPIVRGGNPLDSLISVAYQLIDKNDLKGAMVVVEEAKSIAKEGLARPVSSEEEEYDYNLRKQQLYELDWYEAIILMNDGKFIKAKKALENIASSGNPYAENARNILKDIF